MPACEMLYENEGPGGPERPGTGGWRNAEEPGEFDFITCI